MLYHGGSVPTPTPPSCPSQRGDIDLNGRINMADAQAGYMIAMELYAPEFCEEWRADANADGQVATDDALCLFLNRGDSRMIALT